MSNVETRPRTPYFDGMTVNYARKYPEGKKTRRLINGVPLGWAEIKT